VITHLERHIVTTMIALDGFTELDVRGYLPPSPAPNQPPDIFWYYHRAELVDALYLRLTEEQLESLAVSVWGDDEPSRIYENRVLAFHRCGRHRAARILAWVASALAKGRK
jgi:hypothetical protein